ncbi:MAG: methyltransferase [Pseudomonadota bacterium]
MMPSRILDRIEQVLLLAATLWFFSQIWPRPEAFTHLYNALYAILIVISEGAVILFLMMRKPTETISVRFQDWLIAIVATIGPLFVRPGGPPLHYDLGIILLLTGMALHVGAKLSLNFSFGIVAANRGVRRRGLYGVVRHPMYLGYMTAHTGFFLTSPSWHNAMVYAIVWPLFVARIFAEERVLIQDQAYADFTGQTRYRLVPGVF